MKPSRIPCAVMGCRRTAPEAKYEPGTQIICGKCWRLGGRTVREAYTRNARLLRKAEGAGRDNAAALARRWKNEAWEMIRQQATEARAGIG